MGMDKWFSFFLDWLFSIINTISNWFTHDIPIPLQWLAWIVGVGAVVGILMTILRKIFGKPHLMFYRRKYGNESIGCEILNMPIENKLLKWLVKRDKVEHLTAMYKVTLIHDGNIICWEDAIFDYNGHMCEERPLYPSIYKGAEFKVELSERDSFFDKKKKPLADGEYLLRVEIFADSNKRNWQEPFFVTTVNGIRCIEYFESTFKA